jgi:5-formyltetrahydrofolate cyclo-ligase
VLEPAARACVVEPEQGDVVLVPGVAFDRAGNRLGRGRGYYDRAFPANAPKPPRLIGVAYEVQLVDCVPHAADDRSMDAVVTERAIYWAGRAVP